jgi:hypothetical protein
MACVSSEYSIETYRYLIACCCIAFEFFSLKSVPLGHQSGHQSVIGLQSSCLLVIFKTHHRPKRFTPQNMGAYKTSTTVDFLAGRPMEVKYLFRTPVERAEELGVPVPHLETLAAEIGALQRMHNLF